MGLTARTKREARVARSKGFFNFFAVLAGICGAGTLGFGALALAKGGFALLTGAAFTLVGGLGAITTVALAGALISRKIYKNRVMELSADIPDIGFERIVQRESQPEKYKEFQKEQDQYQTKGSGRITEELKGDITVGEAIKKIQPKLDKKFKKDRGVAYLGPDVPGKSGKSGEDREM